MHCGILLTGAVSRPKPFIRKIIPLHIISLHFIVNLFTGYNDRRCNVSYSVKRASHIDIYQEKRHCDVYWGWEGGVGVVSFLNGISIISSKSYTENNEPVNTAQVLILSLCFKIKLFF